MKKILGPSLMNILLASFSQMIVLIIGFLKSILLPSSMSVNDFGYWQLYLLYISYVGIFFLGYNDAILLSYNKYDLSDMPKKEIRSGNLISIFLLFLFSFFILIASLFSDGNRQYIIRVFAMSIPVWGIFGILIYIYLASNDTKKYTFYNILDQIIFLFFLLLSFLFKNFHYAFFVNSMFISKLLVVLLMILDLRKFIFGHILPLKKSLNIYVENVKSGIFIMISLLFSILLSSFGKVIIDLNGTIENFAAYSFGISISSLIVVFVSAIGTILYPTISRLSPDQISNVFNKMYMLIKHLNYIGLLIYFPICLIISSYFHKYSSLLDYFNYIFLAIIIQNKVLLLYNSYYKILRKEKKMLYIYCISVTIPFVLANIMFYIFNNISQVAFISMMAVIFLDIYSNRFLSKLLKRKNNLITEYSLYLLFILLSKHTFGFLIYTVVLFIYYIKNYKKIMHNLAKRYL